jgi:uncharacterized membrane protein YgdD (TMEM256/DUF423 family)
MNSSQARFAAVVGMMVVTFGLIGARIIADHSDAVLSADLHNAFEAALAATLAALVYYVYGQTKP